MEVIIFLFSNAVVITSALFLVNGLFSEESLVDKLLLAFLFFLAQIIIVELILGSFNSFYLPEVVLFHCVILLIILLIFKSKQPLTHKRPDFSFLLNNKILLLGVSIFLTFFSIKVYINLTNPPVCADSLQYHLFFPALWIKNGNLLNPVCLFGAMKGGPNLSCVTYYPINAQLFFAWLMLPFKGAFLANIGEAPFYLIGIIAVYSILRKFSIDKSTALFSGLLWVLIPNLFKQLRNGSQIDVICAVLFLLVLNNLLLFKKEANFKNALIVGISLGILIGTKILNIIWAGALAPIAIYYFLKKLRAAFFKRIILIILTVMFFAFIFGGYMYLKNFIHTGNPFFPIQIKIFDHLLFRGVMDNASYSKIYMGTYAHEVYDILFCEGLGVQLIAFILPATIIPLIFYRSIKIKDRPVAEYILIFIIPLIMLFAYYFLIHAKWTRYLFPYLGMGLIVAVLFLNKFSWGKKYITILGFIAVIVSAFELAHGSELVISIILSIFVFLFFMLAKNKILKKYKELNGIKFVVIVAVIFTVTLYFLSEKYNKVEFSRYAFVLSKKEAWQRDIAYGWLWLNKNTGEGRGVAYAGRTEVYPLFGSKLKNEVLYVSVNKKSMLPYDLTDGLYRKNKNFNDWLDNMKKLKIDLLFISLPQEDNREPDSIQGFPIEDQWAIDHPRLFSQVFRNSLVHIYKVDLSGTY